MPPAPRVLWISYAVRESCQSRRFGCHLTRKDDLGRDEMGATGIEPMTSAVSRQRSFQLSYAPEELQNYRPLHQIVSMQAWIKCSRRGDRRTRVMVTDEVADF